jgi:hypothetical protein
MSANTHGNLILLGVTLVVLTGCALLVYKVVSGKKGNKCPDGQTFDTISASCIPSCATGTTYYPAYAAFNNGCLQCDPTDTTNCATCSADGDCKNGGKCIMVNGPTGKGICNCVSPYTGNMCDGVCTSTGGQCLNGGTCVSGKCQCIGQWTGQFCEKAQTFTCSEETCSPETCIYNPHGSKDGPTCTCKNNNMELNKTTGQLCGQCKDGYGPWGNGGKYCTGRWGSKLMLTNDCWEANTDDNCINDSRLINYVNLTNLKDPSKFGSATFHAECNTSHGGACACVSGFNTKLCNVTSYIDVPEDVCNDDPRDGSTYHCR